MLQKSFTSVLFWGIVADPYGRKPIMLMGTTSIALFGLSLNFWIAIGTRFLLGSFKCFLGTMEPVDKYPNVLSKECSFGRIWYALPCFTISGFALVVTVLCCFITEPLHNHKRNNTSHDDSYGTHSRNLLMSSIYQGCSFMLGRAMTSVLWGIVAYRFRRKPVILLGTIMIAIFNGLFGLSSSFWMAISMRFLLGIFNCLLGTMKAYASEIFREEYQATAMSAVSTAWGIGLIIGPALGGFLAQPADKYPSLFSKDAIFGRFRYALPCFTISAFALVVTIICCFIPETLHNHERESTSEDDANETLDAESGGSNTRASQGSLLKNWPLMSSIGVYCVLCLHDTSYSEVFALWANSPRRYGGLSYSTNEVGTVLTISGLGLFAFQVFLYPLADRLLGPVLVTRYAAALMIPIQIGYPFIAHLSGLSQNLLLNCASILVNVLSVSSITGMLILQNKAVVN